MKVFILPTNIAILYSVRDHLKDFKIEYGGLYIAHK
jgi:hypothetical protein